MKIHIPLKKIRILKKDEYLCQFNTFMSILNLNLFFEGLLICMELPFSISYHNVDPVHRLFK